MSPSCCWFLTFLWVWWLPLMLVEAEYQQGVDCSTMKCGNVSILDPFWLTDKATGRSCSSDPYPDFDVACINNSIPALRSSIPLNKGFQILNISYEERSFHAIDIGKLVVLDAPDKCRAVFYNTSVKLIPPFKIAPVNLNLILYNCTEKDGAAAAARRDRHLAQTRVRCGSGNAWEVLARAGVPHDATGDYSNYALKGCAAVVVPVPSWSARASASDYEQLFKDGFLLTWELLPHHAPAPSTWNEPPHPAHPETADDALVFDCFPVGDPFSFAKQPDGGAQKTDAPTTTSATMVDATTSQSSTRSRFGWVPGRRPAPFRS